MSVKSEIRTYFGDLPLDVETEAESICRSYGLSPEDLFFKWEAFSMSTISKGQQGASSSKAAATPIFDLANARDLRKDVEASYRLKHPKMELDSTPGSLRGATQKRVPPKAGLNSLLDGINTPTLKKKASLQTNHSPSYQIKTSPKGSSLKPDTDYLDNFSTPSKTTKNADRLEPASSPGPLCDAKAAAYRPSAWVPPKPSLFESRTKTDLPFESLNAHLDVARPLSSVNSRVSLMTNADPKAYNYRYMFEKLSDRGEASDKRIEDGAKIIREAYALEDEFGDPSADSQEESICVGRVCADLYATKLQDTTDRSKSSVWLESSRMMGGGARIELRFDEKLKAHGLNPGDGGVGLFPGSIIGVKGKNVGSQYFHVSEIYMMPPLFPPDSPPRSLLEFQHSQNKLAGRPLSVVTACGPFTTEDNLDFAPFEALMQACKKSQPDVIVLIGPFIDAKHPSIRWGDTELTPKEIFRDNISSRLSHLLQSSTSTTAILVPSLNDVLNQHVAFPQGPFAKDPELGLPKRAKLLPNPATFSINEVVFTITSVDVLFPLRQFEYVREVDTAGADTSTMDTDLQKDPIARICRHVLRQRTVYPMFPAPLPSGGIEAVNLDVTHMDLLNLGSVGADVVILPSKLGNCFAKVVDSAVIVNPARLTQGASGGTYAQFSIHAMPKADLNQELAKANMAGEEHSIDHRVWERARVDLLRI